MIKNQYRQGDVLLNPIKSLPKKAKKTTTRDNGRVILAYGEVTGHAHAVMDCPEIETYEADGKTYLRIKESVDLVHEEHTNHTISPGDYEVTIQREYRRKQIERVID